MRELRVRVRRVARAAESPRSDGRGSSATPPAAPALRGAVPRSFQFKLADSEYVEAGELGTEIRTRSHRDGSSAPRRLSCRKSPGPGPGASRQRPAGCAHGARFGPSLAEP